MNSKPQILDCHKRKDEHFWLVKFAPFRTSWADIVKRGTFTLRGVRSTVSRNHLSQMRLGEEVLLYHSQQELAIVGVMEVTREAYPDPTSADPRWLTCDFAPVTTLAHPVSLATLKADTRFVTFGLIRQPRLAVMPVSESQFNGIMDLAAYAAPAHSITGLRGTGP